MAPSLLSSYVVCDEPQRELIIPCKYFIQILFTLHTFLTLRKALFEAYSSVQVQVMGTAELFPLSGAATIGRHILPRNLYYAIITELAISKMLGCAVGVWKG